MSKLLPVLQNSRALGAWDRRREARVSALVCVATVCKVIDRISLEIKVMWFSVPANRAEKMDDLLSQ